MASVVQDRAGPSRRAPARPLAAFLRLANRDASLAGLMAGAERTVAIAEPAQAFTVAAVAEHGARRPVVVAVPSATAAARLTHEIGAWLGPDQVAFFPAWETLPFERVSPGAETMGRRLELMWRLRRLRDGAPDAGAPAVIVSPVRALLQRLGPHVEDVEPVQVAGGQEVDLHRLVEELVGLGYRREYQVEHRGELAVRGSIVDVFPSTAAGPVRIDLWGDEVDRLTEFSVADQRSWPISTRSLFSAAGNCCPRPKSASGRPRCATRSLGARRPGPAGGRDELRRHGVVVALAHR